MPGESNQEQINISRADLLRGAGAGGVLLTMPALLASCGPEGARLAGPGGQDPIENARAAGLDTPALIAINCGITAPNPHNTQAWKFLIKGEREFELYVDETRLLPRTDPPGRQIHIGQGTFLEHCAIGAGQLGLRAAVELFPEGVYGTDQAGTRPVARVRLEADPGVKKDPLYQAIPARATNRTDYRGPLITAAEFARLKTLVGPTHAALQFVNHPDEMAALTELAFKAMEVETRTVARGEESRLWFRLSDEEIYSKRDGISLRGSGFSGVKLWLVRNFFFSLDKEEFHSVASQDAFLGPYHETLKTTKAYLLWRTAANTPVDWVRTGRDYARVQLALTSLGLVLHPVSQILQEYPELEELRARFGEQVKVQAGEKVQMLARIGRSDYSFHAPRRPVDEMIVKS